ncbi:unnamed protein product [Ixodes pacificus]
MTRHNATIGTTFCTHLDGPTVVDFSPFLQNMGPISKH